MPLCQFLKWMMNKNEQKRGIYIHIPFCKYICSYCDFNKFYIQNQPVDDYINCLVKEIESINGDNIITVYIGGGTPSALNDNQLRYLLDCIEKKVATRSLLEYSFEANPEDLTKERVAILKEYGINRVSMGVQTFNNELLTILGRGHKADDVDNAIKNLQEVGINNINVDLMFALPKQTMKDLYDSMERIVKYNIPHVSCYSLILEQRTKLYNQVESKQVILPTNELEEQMYSAVIDYLTAKGFKQYEISNFSREGFESIHNSNYWHNLEYYGLGAGAHGYINGERYSNIRPVKFYIDAMNNKNSAKREGNIVSVKEQIEEEFFLGLRLLKGINLSYIDKKYNITTKELYKESIEKNIFLGYLSLENDILKLTRKGLFYGNDVFSDFLILED